MKKLFHISLLAAVAIAPVASFGQSPTPAPPITPPPPAAAPSAPVVLQREGPGLLTAQERGALMAAGQKARQDPKVVAAAAKMHDAMMAYNEAMLAKDKSIAPILDKIKAASSPGAARPRLTDAERVQLLAARQAMKGTPEAEAWKKATEDYHVAVREAMMATDPSTAAIFKKLPQPGALPAITPTAITVGTRTIMLPQPPASPPPAPAASAIPTPSP